MEVPVLIHVVQRFVEAAGPVVTPLAISFGTAVATKVTDQTAGAIAAALNLVAKRIGARFGEMVQAGELSQEDAQQFFRDEPVVMQAERTIRELSPDLRRAEESVATLQGKRVLWVDDNPANNFYESVMLKSLGLVIDYAVSTDEADARLSERDYHLVVTDMKRGDVDTAGLTLLALAQARAATLPIIFYVFHLDPTMGTPPGALGITNRPDVLLRYVVTALERQSAV